MTPNPINELDHQIRNRIFFSLYGAVFSAMLGVGIVIPLLPRYAVTMGATGIWIGAIFSAFALARVIFLPVFGKLSDYYGRRKLLLIGLSSYSILSVLYMMAGSVIEITILRFFHGIASAMILPIALAYISDVAPVGGEGKFIGTFVSSIYLGMSFGPFIGGLILDYFTMNAVFLAMAFFSLLALITSLLYVPDIASVTVVKSSFRSIIFHKALQGPILYQLMYALANGTFMVFLPILAIQTGQISSAGIGMVILISILSTTIFQFLFSRFSDRIKRYHLIAFGVGMIGASLLIVPFFQGLLPFLAAALIMGIGRGVSLPAMYALVTNVGREIGQGSASGLVNTSLAVGLIVAPLLSGMVMDFSGIISVFLLSGLICVICTVIFSRMAR